MQMAREQQGDPVSPEQPPQKGASPPNPNVHYVLGISFAVLLIIGGLLFFADTQTQALFKDARDLELLNIQSPRNDGAILLGSLMTGLGFGILFSLVSPLQPGDRWLPATIVVASITLIMTAHFSIFINGLTFPDHQALAVQSAFLFHDTAATAPIATFTLALVTLIILGLGGLALLALIAPHSLKNDFLSPRTLTTQRARLFVVTLLLVAIGARFAREFIAFAVTAETRPLGEFLGMNLVSMVYVLAAALLATLLGSLIWRSCLSLWGNLEDRAARRFRRRHQRILQVETGLTVALFLLITLTLFGDPLHEPPAGSDPVFAISSQGVSWASLTVLGLYLLNRRFTSGYYRFLRKLPRPLPRIKSDRLLAFGAAAGVLWIGSGLLTFSFELSPLSYLTLRLIPIVVLIPFFALRFTFDEPSVVKWSSPASPILIFFWATLSILVGIMLWGIGNSVTVIFSQGSGGFLTPEQQLLQPFATAIRILGSLFIALPMVLALWRLTARQIKPGFTAPLSGKNSISTYTPAKNSTSFPLLILAGLTLIFTMNILLTIDPGSRFDPELGHTDVLVGFWALHVPTDSDVVVMLTLAAASTAIGIISATIMLKQGADRTAPPLPGTNWWTGLRRFLPGRSPEKKRSNVSGR